MESSHMAIASNKLTSSDWHKRLGLEPKYLTWVDKPLGAPLVAFRLQYYLIFMVTFLVTKGDYFFSPR